VPDYIIRDYRNQIVKNNLTVFNVSIKESDLLISADYYLRDEALTSLHKVRTQLEGYIKTRPDFLTSLKPLAFDAIATTPAQKMLTAARAAEVGPMAAVAGVVAECVGEELRKYSRNIIIENGGDIYVETENDIQVGIFAGESPLSNLASIAVKKEEMPLGLCTSSGTVGHSLSFGRADAVCIKAKSAALADAAATAVGNLVKSRSDIRKALDHGMRIDGVLGIVIIIGDHLGAIGDMELHET
jgi:ApbE superfamily uncharacterized protein (UPF0280 family)